MLKKLFSCGLICCLLLGAGVLAQDSAVQELYGDLPGTGSNIVYYDLLDMQAGQTVYVYAAADNFDAFLIVCDIACEEVYADDDDSGGGLNAALEYTFPSSGDYSIAVTDYYNEASSGPFRLLIGLNAPEVLTGNASPHGAAFAVPYVAGGGDSVSSVPASSGEPQVQEFFGAVSSQTEFVYYDLFNVQAGRTLYLYAESTQIDPFIAVCDIDCEIIYAEDDDGGGGRNSALEYVIPTTGDYSVVVTDCCSSSASGEFRILLGLDAPAVLTGNTRPTGQQFAELFGVPMPTPVPPNPGEPQVQEFFGAVSPATEFVYYDLFNVEGGRTVYVYGESTEFDPLVAICDIDCEVIYAEDDDSGGGLNAALEYVLPATGDYSIVITDCCSSSASGVFRILIGLDEPAVLSGNARPVGDEFAVLYVAPGAVINDYSDVVNEGDNLVQELRGSVSPENRYVYFDIFGIEAGQTIQLYAESDTLDTKIGICDIMCEEIYIQDDDSGGGTNSALEYTIPETGDYSIVVWDCCNEFASGDFRLLVGLNTPNVLSGRAVSTNAEIAVVYTGGMGPLADVDRISATDCSVLEERPTLSGPVETYETEHFIIHYTREGVDKASLEFVEDVARVAEEVYRIEVLEFGWPAPPLDCGEGGDERYDVYLMETLEDCCLGYASPEGITVDNPHSEHVERWAAYAHMVIDNDFNGTSAPSSVMRATLVHEFHHTIQFGYDINDELDWFYEATSSWMETQALPEHEDATRYAEAIFEHPDVCIGSEPNSIHGSDRVYGEWLLIDSIVQDHGTDSLKALWNAIADYEGMTAFYAWADTIDTTPQALMQRFAIRNLLHEYELSEYFYGQVRLEGTVKGNIVLSPKGPGVEQLGTSYLHLPDPSLYHFSIDRNNLTLLAVGIDTQAGNARVFELGMNGTADLSSFDDGFLMIFNTSQNSGLDDCQPTSWTLSVTQGDSANAVAPTDVIYNAQNYIPFTSFR